MPALAAISKSSKSGSTANTPTSVAELVRAAEKGEKASFVEIVARYQAMVCGPAFGILNDFSGSEDAGHGGFYHRIEKALNEQPFDHPGITRHAGRSLKINRLICMCNAVGD